MMIKNASIYLGFNITTSIIPFLMLPVFTRYLSVTEYGTLAMFLMLTSLFGSFIGFSSNTYSEVNYHNSDSEKYRRLRFNSYYIAIFSFVPLIIIVCAFSQQISSYFDIKENYVYLALFNSFFGFIYVYVLGQLVIKGKALSHGLLSLSLVVSTALLGILLVVIFDWGVLGRLASISLPLLFFSIIFIIVIVRDNASNFPIVDRKEIKEILVYGIPLIPHLLGGVLLSSGERFVLNQYMSMEEVAMSAVSLQFIGAITVFGQSLNKAYIPWLYKNLSREDGVDYGFLRRGFLVAIVFSLFFMIGCYFFLSDVFMLFVGEKYIGAVDLIFPLSISAIVQYGYFIFGNFLFFSSKTKQITFISMLSSVLHISLLIVLIPTFGLISVAYSFLIVRCVQLLMTLYFVEKEFPELFKTEN